MKISNEDLLMYKTCLENAEKAGATRKRYLNDMRELKTWLGDREVNKEVLLGYKCYLLEHYALSSVNSKLSSINGFWRFKGLEEFRIKTIRVQKQIFCGYENELTRHEYKKLLRAAALMKKKRLYMILLTLGSTGIRISELEHITVSSIETRTAHIKCKGKYRMILLPEKLCDELMAYAAERGIRSGSLFITRNGRPIDRSNISKQLKSLALKTGVSEQKVFPHNMRHLFARTYYGMYKDIVRLADILGHSSVNTTRIYTMESGSIHKQQMEEIFETMK